MIIPNLNAGIGAKFALGQFSCVSVLYYFFASSLNNEKIFDQIIALFTKKHPRALGGSDARVFGLADRNESAFSAAVPKNHLRSYAVV